MAVAPQTGKAARADAGSAEALEEELAECDPGYWSYVRFGSCLEDKRVTYTLYASDGITPKGSALLLIDSKMTLSATQTTWDEVITITLSEVSGSVTAVDVTAGAQCTSPCTMANPTPWPGLRTLTKGQQASGSVTYTDSPAAGKMDPALQTSYRMTATTPGNISLLPPVEWTNKRTIRCDAMVGRNPGCVYDSVRATFVAPVSEFGAAAVLYKWAQVKLPDQWGAGTPLQRLADETTARNNRNSTCYDGSFDHLPEVVDDSCDEFPFAKTHEGGTPGGLCADVIPVEISPNVWEVQEADSTKPVTFTEKCARGHVASEDNEAAGGELGRFTQYQRVLDLERYNLSVPDIKF